MNCREFLVHFIVTLGLLFGLSTCDRIIFRDDDDEDVLERNIIAPVKIPERLLIEMKDVSNLTEFLNRFVERDTNLYATEDIQDGIKGRAPLAGMPTIAKPANCLPEQQVIELEKPGNGAVFLWPPCVRVRRCGGCCTSKMLACTPITTSFHNVTVLQVKYNPQIPDSFESQGYRVFPLEEHDRCSCKCKQQAENCSPLQEFHQNECRCVCGNLQEASECTSPRKVWDSSDCMCKCREAIDCSTGSYFHPVTCRCESSRRSLGVSTFDHLNSSISDANSSISDAGSS